MSFDFWCIFWHVQTLWNAITTTTEQGAAAKQVADNKFANYQELDNTDIFSRLLARQSRFVGSAGRRTGTGDRETHLCYHRRLQRSILPVSEAGRAVRKRGLILRRFRSHEQTFRRHCCSHLRLLSVFECWWTTNNRRMHTKYMM